MSEHPFNLQGDEYWTHPFKNDDDLAERTIFRKQPGLFIDGPPVVDLAVRNTIPIPIFTCVSQRDDYATPLMRYAFLFATRVEDRRAFFGFAVPRDRPMPRVPPGTEPDETSMVTDTLLPDLKQQADLGEEPGTYDVVVLVREHVSNRVRIAVKKSGGYVDPEVEKFIAQQPVPTPAPVTPPAAAVGLPNYRRSETSPEIPPAPGIAISAPRQAPLRPGVQVDVSGSFRVPLLKRELTGASPGGVAPTAVIPMTLFAFSTDQNNFGPFVMPMRVPTYDAIAPTDPMGTGYFAVNLLDFAGVVAKPATFFVYAFVGEWMSGPIQVRLVAP
jgi:hypothetical protein